VPDLPTNNTTDMNCYHDMRVDTDLSHGPKLLPWILEVYGYMVLVKLKHLANIRKRAV